jgi:aqualysin 1
MKRLLVASSLLCVVLAGCGESATDDAPLVAEQSQALPKAAAPATAGAQHLPSRYIVVFRAHVTDPVGRADVLMRGSGGQIHHVYRSALKGFAATIPDAALARIQADPAVAYVEQDQVVTLSDPLPAASQPSPTWGLDRIDQPKLPLDGSYLYYWLEPAPQPPVTAYIIDTGIRATHQDFGGRVGEGYTAINDGRGTNDCNGHGTHVAGTVGGVAWGVAKNVRLVPVRVLNCRGSGTWSGVIAGIDWVTQNAQQPAVANMSLGGGASDAVDDAVGNAVRAGITMVVAAGNDSADACRYSPARAGPAITVAATHISGSGNNQRDARTSWSNYGSCVDLFAPGASITSAWHSNDTATNTISGTSMSSPHVAGVAALLLETDRKRMPTPAIITETILSQSTKDLVADPKGSPNRLLYSRADSREVNVSLKHVSVGNLSGSRSLYRNAWTATVKIAVRDSELKAVGDAAVSGTFSPGGSVRCTTGADGTCSVTSSGINNSTGSTTFSVGPIEGSSIEYNPQNNVHSQITIYKDGTTVAPP